MTDGFGAIISENTKDIESLKKKITSDLEKTFRLKNQLGVASCRLGSGADCILHLQMDDKDISNKKV